MERNLEQIKREIFDKCNFDISNFQYDSESREYDACSFALSGKIIISRNAKLTPRKAGQFVTFWKRSSSGPIEPFHELDRFDFYIVNARSQERFGQFVFPKTVLVEKGIVSSTRKEGKRAFRVYSSWDVVQNKQAELAQSWQLKYFYEIDKRVDFEKVKRLYSEI